MTDETSQEGLKERITRQGEDTIGRLAQDLLENPLLNGAITRARSRLFCFLTFRDLFMALKTG